MRVIARLILFALPLSLDNFALSTLVGVTPMSARQRLRLATTFAAAEGLMPAVGLLLGLPLGNAIGGAGEFVAGALMLVTGFWLWRRARSADDDDDEAEQIRRAVKQTGWALVGIALGISLDELAVGFSFGVLRLPFVPALLVLGGQALLVSLLGQSLGRHLGTRFGERLERLTGPAVCILGLSLIGARLLGLPV